MTAGSQLTKEKENVICKLSWRREEWGLGWDVGGEGRKEGREDAYVLPPTMPITHSASSFPPFRVGLKNVHSYMGGERGRKEGNGEKGKS